MNKRLKAKTSFFYLSCLIALWPQGVTKLAFIDLGKHKSFAKKSYKVTKPGEILTFGNDKRKPYRYKGIS